MIKEIKKFLDEANKAGYGAGENAENKWVKELDHSTTITYESEDKKWKYHDNFFGGEPYGGREVVFYENAPKWMMVYYGEVGDKTIDKKIVYKFLQQALRQADPDLPVRGPKHLAETVDGKEWVYEMTSTGDLNRFVGHEIITIDGVQIYDADFSGGLVDLSRD